MVLFIQLTKKLFIMRKKQGTNRNLTFWTLNHEKSSKRYIISDKVVVAIKWRVDIQKGVTHISEILHGGTETFPFWHLEIQIFDFQIENTNISDWKKNPLRYCIGINLKNLFRQKNDFWIIVGYALLNVHSSNVKIVTIQDEACWLSMWKSYPYWKF